MNLASIRRRYAEEICVVGDIQSRKLIDAFAIVPREQFFGAGPWYYACADSATGEMKYRVTEDGDPKRLYHNISIVIDAERNLPNGHPSTIGLLIDSLNLKTGDSVLHVGCGTGYFSAIMAEVVGANGRITAIEIENDLAVSASQYLSHLSQVNVVCGDGTTFDSGPVDAILVNAGVAAISPLWVDNLKPGGRLIVPLTIGPRSSKLGRGIVFKAQRNELGYQAQFITQINIYHCFGAREEEDLARVQAFLRGRKWLYVNSLRRDVHEITGSCCMHNDLTCLSALRLRVPSEAFQSKNPKL